MQSYQIGALWERNRELGMLSQKSTQAESAKPDSLSQVAQGQKYLRSKKNMWMEDCKEAFQAMNRLLQLVTEQEKLYRERLSSHSNFYRCHTMVQQFLQSQLNNTINRTRKEFSKDVARCFGKGRYTAKKIMRWEISWIDHRVILARKDCEDSESLINDEDLRISIRDFAKKQDNCTYY